MLRQAVILCGGLGTRLGGLTAETPKPLLPVDGNPFLDVLLFELGRHGIARILLLAGFAAHKMQEYALTTPLRARFGLELDVSVEPQRAGTGGALWHARDRLDDAFLLLNGDSWFDINLLELARHADDPSATVVIAVRHLADASRFGVVEIDKSRVTRFHERPAHSGEGFVSGGVYACQRALVDSLDPVCSLEADVFPCFARQGKLLAISFDGYFIDIGVPDSFARAGREIPRQRQRPAAFLGRDGVLNQDDGSGGSRARFRWIDGAKAAVKLLNDKGLFVFVVTNQAGLAHGLYSEEDVRALHAQLTSELAAAAAHLDDLRYCQFHPDAILSEYRPAGDWPRPASGMITDLLETWPVDRKASFLIGERPSDCAAASAASIESWLFPGGDLPRFVSNILSSQEIRGSRF
jgi:D-glycero-D-manno-heptose 1,7-bisphosphate phosphatase